MPSKATYGDFRKAIEKHHEVISRLEEKLLLKQRLLWARKDAISSIPDETALTGADEADMLSVEQSSNALEPVAEPSELWVC